MANAKAPIIISMLGVVVLGFTGALVFFLTAQSDAPRPEPPEPVRPVEVVEIDGSEPRPIGEVAPAARPAPVAAPERRAKPSSAERMARDLKREQIWQALGTHRTAPSKATAARPEPGARAQREPLELPPLDTQYIQDAIREQLVPVAVECYESALEDEPELAGKLLVEFTIVGAEAVGGVVESANIHEDSTLDSAFVRECMRESVMAVTFEPPEDGGQIAVTYPFEFLPD